MGSQGESSCPLSNQLHPVGVELTKGVQGVSICPWEFPLPWEFDLHRLAGIDLLSTASPLGVGKPWGGARPRAKLTCMTRMHACMHACVRACMHACMPFLSGYRRNARVGQSLTVLHTPKQSRVLFSEASLVQASSRAFVCDCCQRCSLGESAGTQIASSNTGGV